MRFGHLGLRPIALRLLALVVGTVTVAISGTAQAAERAPVLVELFTSEGCSSCPPAVALAGRLTQRDDVFVLSFHVDYWDYIGWKDRFATKETTERQHSYARALGQRSVYTPEMVIAGVSHRVGSDEAAVQAEIAKVAASRPRPPGIKIGLAKSGAMRVTISGAPYSGVADVFFVRFFPKVESIVDAGENSGRTLPGYNVVKSIRRVGGWSGDATQIDIPRHEWFDSYGEDGCAVIVQAAGQGAVLGVHEIDMEALRRMGSEGLIVSD